MVRYRGYLWTNSYLRKRETPPETCLCRDMTAQELDELCAVDSTPIRYGDANPWPERLKLIERGTRPYESDRTFRLVDGLLQFGGAGVATNRVAEDELRRLPDTGQLWSGKGSRRVGGEAINCHGNSSLYGSANMDKAVLASGFALSKDGLWRSHTWCVLPGESPTIVETTLPRLLYYGETMDAVTAQTFYADNARSGSVSLLPAPVRDAVAMGM